MLIVRLIPGPPFAVSNYAAGIARMRFRDYFWATLIGVIPSHIVFTHCADSLVNGTMTQGDALKRLAIVCVLLLALIAIPLVFKKRMGHGCAGSRRSRFKHRKRDRTQSTPQSRSRLRRLSRASLLETLLHLGQHLLGANSNFGIGGLIVSQLNERGN
jgi:hypothetical protein